MAGKISVECPSCSAKLSLSDSSKLGKKIRCPKCSETFVPEAPDDDEDFEDDEIEDEPKRGAGKKSPSGGAAASKGAKKGAKKGGSSGGGSNLPVIIGGVVGLLALVGAGLFFSGIFNSKPLPAPPAMQPMAMAAPPAPPPPPQISPAEKVLGLRWMPAETDLIVHAKLADIWQAPLLKEPLKSPSVETGLKEFEKQFGMPPSEIESVTIGIVDLTGGIVKMLTAGPPAGGVPGFGMPAFPTMSPQEVHYVTVVRTKKPIDLKLISQAIPNAAMRDKNGKPYFEVAANLMQPANGGWSPESNTLVLATSNELMATIERGETVVPRKELAGINHLPQLVIAGVVRGLRSDEIQKAEAAQKENPAFLTALLKANEKYALRLAALGLTVKGGFDLQVSAYSNTTEGSQNIKAEFESFLKELRSMFDGYKTTAPPLIGELGELLLTNLKIEEQNQKVSLSTGVPDSVQEKLEQLPPVIMMMAMMGGFGGAPGGLPGGPPMGAPPNFGASPGSFPMDQPPKVVPTISLPGETESVESAMVEGLPEGLTLTAKAAWSTLPVPPTSDGKGTGTIEILIDVTGDDVDTICAATGASAKTLTIDGGTLKKSKRTLPGGIDAQKTFLAFDTEHSLPGEHPPETLRVRLAVDAPTSLPTKIDVLEGSFKIMTAGKSQELTIENVPQKAKSPLNDPEFKAAGIKLIRSAKDVIPQTLKLQCDKDHYLGRVRGTPGDVLSLTEVEKGVTIQRIYANQADGKFPDEFEIAFKLHTDLKEQTVTFRFENVPLPTAETKPGPPQ